MSIRIVVVNGDTLTRYGLSALVAQHADLEIVAEAGSAAGAPLVVAANRPDVVTIDAALAGGGSLRLARELRDRDAGLGIVVLTSSARDDDVLFRALDTGVSAFVSKAAPVGEVLGAIRHAAAASSSRPSGRRPS